MKIYNLLKDKLLSNSIVHNKTLLNEILDKAIVFRGYLWGNADMDNLQIGWYNFNSWTQDGGIHIPAKNKMGVLLVFENTQILVASGVIYTRPIGSGWATSDIWYVYSSL